MVISLSSLLIFSSLKNIRYGAELDEGYYLKYATAISERGLAGFPELVQEYARTPKDWLFPSPLRAGFIVIASFWLRAAGYSFEGLSYLSLCAYLLFMIVSFSYARKYFGERIALLLAILLAFSPLQMAMARRALTDSLGNLCATLSLWLFFDHLEDRSRLRTCLFILSYSLTILVRETSIVLSGVFLLYLLLRKFVYKTQVNVMDFLSASVIPFGIVAVVYISLAGSFGNILEILKAILIYPKENYYVSRYCDGPWFRYLVDFLLLSPWATVMSIGFIGYSLAMGKIERAVSFLLLFLVVYLISMNLMIKNVRYIITLDMPLRLFCVLMLTLLARKWTGRFAFPVSFTLVAILAMNDYYRFVLFFSIKQIYDPVTFFLLKAYKIIP